MEEVIPHLLCCYTRGHFGQRIIRYLKKLFEGSRLNLTFYHLIEIPRSLLLPSRDYLKEIQREEELEEFIKREKESLLKELGEISEDLRKVMDLKTTFIVEPVEGDKAERVLQFVKERDFTAVVMGKRGLGKLASIWAGSFSQKMLLYSSLPLWIVRNKVFNRNILVAFDLGERGLRVIDYALNILSHLKDYRVTFFHCLGLISKPSFLEGSLEDLLHYDISPDLKEFLLKVQTLTSKANLPQEKISFKITSSFLGAAPAIIREVKRGEFTTVVIGRRGRGGFPGLLLGSVSSKLISSLESEAIWIVP